MINRFNEGIIFTYITFPNGNISLFLPLWHKKDFVQKNSEPNRDKFKNYSNIRIIFST